MTFPVEIVLQDFLVQSISGSLAATATRSATSETVVVVESALDVVDQLDDDARVDLLLSVSRLEALAAALKARALSAFDETDDSTFRLGREQAAAALRVPPRGMAQRFAEAHLLVKDLPAVLGALQSGDISPGHARAIGEGATRLLHAGPETVGAFESAVLSGANRHTVGQLRREVKRQVLKADPGGSQVRAALAARDRAVVAEALDDGMAALHWIAPAVEVQSVFARLDAAARSLPAGDARTIDQQRSDLFGDALLTALSLPALPTKQGRAVQVNVHVKLSTLLGLDEHPGHLDGYGPLTRSQALELLNGNDTTWRRWTVDDRDRVIQISPTYRPPQAIRDLVLANYPTCVAPGCGQPSQSAQLDHLVPHSQGGATSTDNIFPLCTRHHQGKTRCQLRYVSNPDGSHSWTLGTRHRYVTRPEPRLEPDP